MEQSAKIYIAGHRGMVGSGLERKLRKEGYNNIVKRTSAELDLRNQQAVNDFFQKEKPTYVILAAAKVGGIHANNTYRAEFIYDNLMMEANIIHAAYLNKVKKLLFLGSSCIYPKMAPQPLKEDYLLSGYLEQTNQPYAIAKIAGIEMCDAYRSQYGCNFISVMPTNLYGPRDNFELESSHVLPALIHRFHSAKIAREIADEFSLKEPNKPRFVAGSIGPTNRTASISPDVNDPSFRNTSFDELNDAYQEQVNALIDGGVDLILIETVFDTLNAKAALFAVEKVFESKNISLPVMVSGTITDASGRTLTGQTTEAFLISMSHFPLFSVGLNCALGAADMQPYLKTLARKAPFYISAHPNAGLPNEFGEYDETPEMMTQQIESFLEDNLINIIGGCCGTTPEHIKAISNLASNYNPRILN